MRFLSLSPQDAEHKQLEAQTLFERQHSEMVAMLEKYKSDSEKTMVQKDRDIDTLRQTVSDAEKREVNHYRSIYSTELCIIACYYRRAVLKS